MVEQETDLVKVVERLEFDGSGTIVISIEDILSIELQRLGGIQLGVDIYGNSHSKTHFADYRLVNDFGTSEGRFFLWGSGINAIFPSGVPFEVMPGLNRLELLVYERENPEDKQPFFYEFEVDGRVYQSGDAVFIMEDHAKNYSDEFLDRMAQLSLLFESNLEESQSIKTFKLSSNQYGFSSLRQGFIEIGCAEQIDEGDIESTLVHEKSHDFYGQLAGENKVEEIFGFETRHIVKLNNGSYGQRLITPDVGGRGIAWYEKDTVIGLFAERYYDVDDTEAGHPWDSPSELFASATTLMVTHPKELIGRISRLPIELERNLAKDIMIRVVDLYEKYCKTGTQLFSDRVLAYVQN